MEVEARSKSGIGCGVNHAQVVVKTMRGDGIVQEDSSAACGSNGSRLEF